MGNGYSFEHNLKLAIHPVWSKPTHPLLGLANWLSQKKAHKINWIKRHNWSLPPRDTHILEPLARSATPNIWKSCLWAVITPTALDIILARDFLLDRRDDDDMFLNKTIFTCFLGAFMYTHIYVHHSLLKIICAGLLTWQYGQNVDNMEVCGHYGQFSGYLQDCWWAIRGLLASRDLICPHSSSYSNLVFRQSVTHQSIHR